MTPGFYTPLGYSAGPPGMGFGMGYSNLVTPPMGYRFYNTASVTILL